MGYMMKKGYRCVRDFGDVWKWAGNNRCLQFG